MGKCTTITWVKVQNFHKVLNFRNSKFKPRRMPTKTNNWSLNDELCVENLNINQRSYYYLPNSGLILKTFTHTQQTQIAINHLYTDW